MQILSNLPVNFVNPIHANLSYANPETIPLHTNYIIAIYNTQHLHKLQQPEHHKQLKLRCRFYIVSTKIDTSNRQ